MNLLFLFKQLLKFLYCVLTIQEYRWCKFPYFNKYEGEKAMIMGNGPSLNTIIQKYELGTIDISPNSFFVNLAPLSDVFYKVKPRHLFLSDLVFAQDTPGRSRQVKEMYEKLNTGVDWPLNIYLTFYKKKYCEMLISYSGITNPNIKFIILNKKYCDDLSPRFRNWLYKNGWFMPYEGTVVNTAIYVALLEGFKEIEVFGVEHNMFLDLKVDNNNNVGIIEKHFYGKDEFIPLKDDNGKTQPVHYFLSCMFYMLRSHWLLKQFADYMGATIYNCTPNSMIDSYERKILDL